MDIDFKKFSTHLSTDFSKVSDFTSGWNGVALCILVENQVIFFKRVETMPTHKGHLAFVGGNRKSVDQSPLDTAKREFFEETSLSQEVLQFLGYLPIVQTTAQKIIVPLAAFYSGSIQEFFNKIVSNGEWEEALAIDFKILMREEFWKKGAVTHRLYNEIFFRPLFPNEYKTLSGLQKEVYLLWGATARMVQDLIKIWKNL